MTLTITITDPLSGHRIAEPITFTIPDQDGPDLRWATTWDGQRILCQKLRAQTEEGTTYVAVLDLDGAETLTLTLGEACAPSDVTEGITADDPGREADCFVRLNTGAFDLEMCSGTAQGTGASKWGLRHFRGLHDDFELLPSGNNAIGGFYGPFFTPENGLINPPEHTTVRIETVEKGPVMHRYRMHGTIPDGLLEELKGRGFTIEWTFTYRTPFFQRRYEVDPFRTVINGRAVENKITVGDEFEGGRGELVFDRFAAYHGTTYRAGDPYAGLLVDMVSKTLKESEADNPKFRDFRAELQDMEAAHWDLYWRMFCVWEGVLSNVEITERLGRVRALAHSAADHTDRDWQMTDTPIEVSASPHETIFSTAANKTVEFHAATGRAMVWYTSKASGAFQIVQRKQSGWVNWGTNGENECPELPVGVHIKTAYGPYAKSWKSLADHLEIGPDVNVEWSL